MLETVKLALRVSTSLTDNELKAYINSASLDMINTGVSSTKAFDYDDGMIKIAVIHYCKYMYGDSTYKDFHKAEYRSIVDKLSYVGVYHESD